LKETDNQCYKIISNNYVCILGAKGQVEMPKKAWKHAKKGMQNQPFFCIKATRVMRVCSIKFMYQGLRKKVHFLSLQEWGTHR